MGDLSKLKIAIAQPELVDGCPARNALVRDRMMERAVDAGADVLVMPESLTDASDVRLIALNDSRIDVAGNIVMLEAAGEQYHIGLGKRQQSCDFSVYCDTDPWVCSPYEQKKSPGIALRPVGMRNSGHKVLTYDGATSVYSSGGTLIARLRDDFEEDFALVSLDEQNEIVQPCSDKLLAALVKTIRRFDQQVLPWEPKWVIGLSGGLDSSVVAALLTLALGPERVIGYSLSTAHNTEETKANAAVLAESLGIELRTGSIAPLVDATDMVVSQYGYGQEGSAAIEGLALENVQARVRGHLLSTFASLENGVVANNGNRVEAAFGYATLYGDAIGALAPIGDLVKTRLFDLARTINGQPGCEIIPENLLPRETSEGYEWDLMPSAELSEGQRDPMKWFYHDWLVEQLLDSSSVDEGACRVLENYLDDRLANSEVGKWISFYGLDDPQAFVADFDWCISSMKRNAFKRIQAPPAITIASVASVNRGEEQQGDREPSFLMNELRERIMRL